jgi:hypothetical protein
MRSPSRRLPAQSEYGVPRFRRGWAGDTSGVPDAAEVIEDALDRFVSQLAGHLESDGWRLRTYEVWPLAVFTRDVGGGFLASVEVFGMPLGDFLRSGAWPIRLYLVFGCGYEPATALMPLLALAPKAALITESRPAVDVAQDVTLSGPDSVDGTAMGIADEINRHGVGFAQQHASVDALDAAMTARDRLSADLGVTLRPVLWAAAGQHDRARALVDDFVNQGAEAADDEDYPRFVRQLHRWLDAGGSPIPPVEETLSRLPPPPARPPWPSMEKARQGFRDRRSAWNQVRAQARGKSTDELTTMLAAAYAAHGVETAPSMLAKGVEQLRLDLRLFGRARRNLQGFTELGAVLGLVKGMFADDEPDPAWLQPPERASYPLPTNHRRWAAVKLNPNTRNWLARVPGEAARRAAGIALIDTWLTDDGREPDAGILVVVHIGDRVVGTLSAEDAREFAPHLAAAMTFDEDLRVPGRVSPAAGDLGTALEIAKPDLST